MKADGSIKPDDPIAPDDPLNSSQRQGTQFEAKAAYGVALVFVSSLVACSLYLQGASYQWLLALVAAAIVMAIGMIRLLVYILPLLMLGNVNFSVAGYLDPTEPLVVGLGIGCLAMISLSHRLLVRSRGAVPADAVRDGWTTAVRRTRDLQSRSPPGAAELASLLLLPAAWFAASVLSDWASAFDPDIARAEFGLLPPTYLAVRLCLVLAAAIFILRTILDYLRSTFSTGRQASITLRQELWDWNGREQRIVSRTVNRARRWNEW
jgi:hypothetical protein